MPSDRGRPPERVRFGYDGVVAQQGRVILDRDFNAQQTYTADRIADDALDFVGPCGTPDDGFRISLRDTASSPPSFWSPPGGASPPEAPGGPDDFLIGPGTMYIGGQRVCFPSKQNGKTITYSYFDQPDWPTPDPDLAAGKLGSPPHSRELIYLSLQEQEVGAVEDPDLLEVALGGPDTTQRLKLLRRVHRLHVTAADCETAWQAAVADWARNGLTFDPDTMRLKPGVRMNVGFTTPLTSGDLCDPVATGGYLGNDNQLIRVRIDRSNNTRRVLWGYDNASFLYRVVDEGSDGMTLTLASDPPDAFHFPRTGQWVEVLTTAAILAREPDESDPTHEAEILRVAAASTGQLCQVKQFGPQPGGVTNVLTIDKAVPKGTRPLFVRVWQAAQTIPTSGTVTLQTTETDATGATVSVSTGLTVTFSPATAEALTDGTFWQFAVRPATPQGVYPEDLLVLPQMPDGPQLWACPLAVIDWTDRTVTDCRNTFDNLVTLSRRKPGCCTVSIMPRDVTATNSLQTLIDRAMRQAAILTSHPMPTVTVCLAAGEYVLPRTLYLDKRHAGLTLEACGGAVVLSAHIQSDMTPFTDGLIALVGVPGVTLRGLELHAPVVEATAKFLDQLLTLLNKDGFAAAARILRRPFTSFGVRALNAPELTLDRCVIRLAPNDTSAATKRLLASADFFGAAVFARGNCVNARIVDCEFASTIEPTYSPMTVNTDVASPAALAMFRRMLAAHFDIVTSPPSSERLAVTTRAAVASDTLTIENEAEGALDLLVSKRLAGDLTAPRYTVVTVGVLAAPSYHATCVLGQALVRDCAFDGFTFATWFVATFASLRLADNSVSDGVAGLWLEVPNTSNRPRAGDIADFQQSMLLFEEYQLLVALAATFPAPTPPSTAHLRSLAEHADIGTVETHAPIDVSLNPSESKAPAPYSLLVTGNQVDVRQQTETIGASAALRLALYREQVLQPMTSVIVSSNRFCGGMVGGGPITQGNSFGKIIPAALITLVGGTPCSITGNVIINRGGSAFGLLLKAGEVAPSLWLVVSGASEGVIQLAVTGNVLQGESDLDHLRRLDVKTITTWAPLNANPA